MAASPSTRHIVITMLCLATGCFGQPAPATTETDTEATTAAPTSDADPGDPTTVSSAETTASSDPADDTASTGDASDPICGNGIVEAGEECDDGDRIDGNGCNHDCLPSGRRLFTVTFNGQANADDAAYAVGIDDAGAVVATGVQINTLGNLDLWLRKYAADGAIVWTAAATPFAGQNAAGPDFGDGLSVTGRGDVFACGQFATQTEGNNGWVRRYGRDGMLMWSHPFGLAGADHCEVVEVTDEGRVLAAGWQTEAGGVSLPWIMQFSLEGEVIQAYFVGLPADTAALAFAIAPLSSGFAVAGRYSPSVADDDVWVAWFNDRDAWAQLVAIDPSRSLRESAHALIAVNGDLRAFGYAGAGMARRGLEIDVSTGQGFGEAMLWRDLDVIEGAVVDPVGNVIIAGRTLARENGGDAFVAKLDPEGRMLWSDTHDGAVHGSDGFEDVSVSSSGEIAVAGFEAADGQGTNALVIKYAP